MIKHKTKIYNVVVVLAFVMSMTYTFLMFAQGETRWFGILMAIGTVLVLEPSSILLLTEGLSNENLPKWSRAAMVTLGIILNLISIMGSASYLIGTEIQKINDNIKNGIGYQSTVATIDIAKQNIASTADQRESINNRYNDQVASKKEVMSKLPNDWITKRNNMSKEIDIIEQNRQNELAKLQDSNNTSLATLQATSQIKPLTVSSGYQVLFNALDGKTPLSKTQTVIQILIAFIIQATMIATAYALSQMTTKKEYVAPAKIEEDTSPTLDFAELKKKTASRSRN